ncbi:MAG TPA: hypothetical protein PLO06_11395, partial [Methanoregulaceae archaeon]|nr:hypothetical protein [Methanoregulaceae archaeon]
MALLKISEEIRLHQVYGRFARMGRSPGKNSVVIKVNTPLLRKIMRDLRHCQKETFQSASRTSFAASHMFFSLA